MRAVRVTCAAATTPGLSASRNSVWSAKDRPMKSAAGGSRASRMPSPRNSAMVLPAPMFTALKKAWKKSLRMPMAARPIGWPARPRIWRTR